MSETLNLAEGAALQQEFIVTDVAGEAYDLTDAYLVFAVHNPNDEEMFVLKSAAAGGSSDEIQLTGPTNGKCVVKILSDHTDLLTGPEYKWSLVLTIASEPYVLVSGPVLMSKVAGL